MRSTARTVLLSIALAAGCVSATRWNAQPKPQGQVILKDEAEQLLTLANQSRAKARAPALQWDPALAAAALKHCLWVISMMPIGQLSHQYSGEADLRTRARRAGARFDLIEENVAAGPSVDSIHEAWMKSPDHRENLLNPQANCVGVAVVAADGVLYAVADYSHFRQVVIFRGGTQTCSDF
ncbi:MAG TPA: CAP domain-containing protein [Terracidiphilus sp.]|jgi:uncharacterized protein YkwD